AVADLLPPPPRPPLFPYTTLFRSGLRCANPTYHCVFNNVINSLCGSVGRISRRRNPTPSRDIKSHCPPKIQLNTFKHSPHFISLTQLAVFTAASINPCRYRLFFIPLRSEEHTSELQSRENLVY